MSNLQYRQSIIQEKRKSTPWRKFVMEICSRAPYNLYKRDGLITVYKDKDRIPTIIPAKHFNANRDSYGLDNQEIKTNNGFFSDISSLISKTSLPNITEFKDNEAGDFANIVAGVKNAYLSFNITSGSENILYSSFVKGSSQMILDSLSVTQYSNSVYKSIGVNQSMDIFYSKFIDNSNNIWFSDNLVGCSECLFCDNLQNQSYCIKNKTYSKDEYFIHKIELLAKKDEFDKNYESIQNRGINMKSDNCEGEAVNYSQNVHKGRFVSYVNGGGNLFLVGGNEQLNEVFDTFGSASWATNHCYAGVAHGSGDHHYCNYNSAFGSNVYYSLHCESCSFIVGCVGLRNKSYCILNKQYTKEERYEKVDKIFGQMHADGNLGNFFPASMNPFYFNDTAAYLIDPSFTKEEVTAAGYLRRDEPIKVDIPADAKIVQWNELDKFEGWKDEVWVIDPEILKYVIQDEQGNCYRIIPMEYKFLMKHALPLPRKHRLERMKENFRIS